MEPPVLDANINNNDIDGNLVDEDDGNVRMEEDEITLVAADATEHARDDDDEEEEEDEDEDECRVCRGPAEEGRPLLRPCKCSGSMGLVHQECLISWLEVTRGDGRCEICKHKFKFDPQYAENTPDRLSSHEVILGLSSRFLAKWLPLALRIVFAAILWLVVAPYLTNCLYLGWIIRPSSVLGRGETIASDTVSGLVMGATIIISFLSLMSFADFLRVLWQGPPGAQQPEEEGQPPDEERENDGFAAGENEDEIDEFATDHRIIEWMQKRERMKEATTNDIDATITIGGALKATEEEIKTQSKAHVVHEVNSEIKDDDNLAADFDRIGLTREAEMLRNRATELRNLALEREARRKNADDERERVGDGDHHGEEGTNGRVAPLGAGIAPAAWPDNDNDDAVAWLNNNNDDDEIPEFAPLGGENPDIFGANRDVLVEDVEEDAEEDDDSEAELEAWMNNDDDEDDDIDDEIDPFPPLRPGLDDAEVAFDPLDPVLQDDQVDMEINVALDELLGLRGPIMTVVRNLLWLLAFNATYLGIFGFVPKAVGSVIYSSVFNTTACGNLLKSIPFVASDDTNQTTVSSLLISLEQESDNRNTSFKLSDFATVTLGYLSMACFIVSTRYTIIALQKVGKLVERNRTNTGRNQDYAQQLQRVQRLHNLARDAGEDINDLNEEENIGGIGDSIETALDATVAIIKVCILLFMKMFLLPLYLGLWLDASTVHLFGHNVAGRLAFAGEDLFSFILLHWVAGITFMLLVTVFLLQLREVAHPEILARLIRPQEPQPDLLGNLMHETVLTHMKRMTLSLAIYAPLLTLHVTIPAMLFHKSGLDSIFTFFHLNFYHLLTPQLQIPLELITFHLSMLALLERHKNNIGGLQHYWMKFMCRKMGLTEYLLPQHIEAFEFIGRKNVFKPQSSGNLDVEVDPFFIELTTRKKDIDKFVLSHIEKINPSNDISPSIITGEQHLNGERVLCEAVRSISLPGNTEAENGTIHLPTKIGRYSLKIEEDDESVDSEELKISFYREIQGEEIKRPPEGWDDLGAGGAYVQGRWAWAKERKSLVEESIAERIPFRASSEEARSVILITKVAILVILSWVALISTVVSILSCPLAIGRSFYHLLRIPAKYIHDPFAFCIGAGLFFPFVSWLTQNVNDNDLSLYQRLRQWFGRFQRPPTPKMLVLIESLLLWTVAAPLGLGLSYELVMVKSPKWFAMKEPFLDIKTLAISWLMGTVVLNTWSFLLYCKFFTRRFWSNVGNGILEPPLNEDGNPNHNARNNAGDDANAEIGLIWQGKRGRAGQFFNILRSVILDWEWDTVDRKMMIDDFARPTTKEITSALVGSALSYQLALHILLAIFKVQKGGFMFPLVGFVETGIFRKGLYQICMTVHVLFQIGSRSRVNIDSWFEAAHEAARDDRYLIGELLMNYNPEG